MRTTVILIACMLTLLLTSGVHAQTAMPTATPVPTSAAPLSVVKRVCSAAYGYGGLEDHKADLLLIAKREAANELFGELIAASTTVDDLVVTSDQIRLQTLGLVRLQGSATYANGPNLAEVCATITAYATEDDLAQFEPVRITQRSCRNDPAQTISALRLQTEAAARRDALVAFDPRLDAYTDAAILPLLRRLSTIQVETLPGTDTYCITIAGEIIPIEVVGFLSLDDGQLAVTPTPTNTPTPTFTSGPTLTLTRVPTIAPTPQSPASEAAVMATAVAAGQYVLHFDTEAKGIYVYVPAGHFTMGSNDAQDAEPPHQVYVDAFWIMFSEVTNGQYTMCVAAGACTAPNNSGWQDTAYTDHPVTDVDWEQANDYAAWVGGRLPTEEEWEKAARGTDAKVYPWGNSELDCTKAVYHGCVATTSETGSVLDGASPYGAVDMAGNVWEWTATPWEDDPARRVVRGGSWYSNEYLMRAATRNWEFTDERHDGLGFRVILPANSE